MVTVREAKTERLEKERHDLVNFMLTSHAYQVFLLSDDPQDIFNALGDNLETLLVAEERGEIVGLCWYHLDESTGGLIIRYMWPLSEKVGCLFLYALEEVPCRYMKATVSAQSIKTNGWFAVAGFEYRGSRRMGGKRCCTWIKQRLEHDLNYPEGQ